MNSSSLALVALLAASLLAGTQAWHLCASTGPCQRDSQILPMPDLVEDFQFELRNLYTNRQRGARVNIFVKFRYYTTKIMKDYSTETGTYDYQDMKQVILPYVPAGGMNITRDTFWEIVNREMTKDLWSKFPIQGISVRMEVQGMSSGGIPSHRASTVTIGNIEPWASMVNSFPGCDGMGTSKGNAACKISPTWDGVDAKEDARLSVDAAAKAGKHDKPSKCDTCA
ncbi:hypothetical protein HXX76_007867 [Chlamydomonas incerta]|uniref:Uncharacterized protein n=1 Tax=Chlamydomonas incerta TaxID=51695 RepID=A0A835VZY1_CHLIN|nr:hypothetical protein HXX76_007867 [Chlamydomonas incerta]|eukprot:KAG2434140.1 hypothetical protein HXX76_007867 [Chlamydomonas incerta]